MVLCFDENGHVCRFLTTWTDYMPPDLLCSVTSGKAAFRYEDLSRINELLIALLENLSS